MYAASSQCHFRKALYGCSDLMFSVCVGRLKIFVPIAFLAWTVLVPVNWTSTGLEGSQIRNITSSDIDKLSVSNVHSRSERLQFLHSVLLQFCYSICMFSTMVYSNLNCLHAKCILQLVWHFIFSI